MHFPKHSLCSHNTNEIERDKKRERETKRETKKNKEKQEAHYNGILNNSIKRIVFPRSIDNLGFVLYRFKGVFETDKDNSTVTVFGLKKNIVKILINNVM